MNDLIINVEKSTRMVMLTKTTIGNDTENLQEKLIFKFTDSFVNGQGRLEYKINSEKNYIVLTKENNTYTLPIQNVIAKEGRIEMQLVITEGTEEENIPVFKSNVFYLYCNKSINAVDEAPEGYDLWIEQANAKLNAMDEALTEVDNLDIDASKSGDTATISITNKEGITKTVQIEDGEKGDTGPANTLSIGTVEKGDEAQATITGDAPNQTLNLVLPKGDKGDKGNKGDTGATGPSNTLSIGTVTKGDNASATITGTSPNQTLNLVLPKGDKGDKGDKGNTGAAGNDGYSPSASVSKSGDTATITITDKNGTTTATVTDGEEYDDTEIRGLIAQKQDTLVSGTNIKTINNTSLLGSGNINISGGGTATDVQINGTSIVSDNTANILTNTAYSASTNKIATMNDLPDISGKQNVIDSSHKLSADLVDDTSTTNKFVTSTEKTKLSGIEAGAEVNVQSDWNEADDTKDDYIKNKPTIPTVNNATLTIQKNSTTIDTFTANASVDKTINIAVPTDTSDLTNGAGYTTNTGTITSVKMNGTTVSSSGEADLGTVITSHQDISGKEDRTNKVTSLSSSSTDTQYPSAKCVYDMIGDVESILIRLTTGGGVS